MSKNNMKRLLSLLLALVLTLGCIGVNTTQSYAASKTKVGAAYYTVTSEKNCTAEYVKPTKKTCTSVTIPDTVKIGSKTYNVTSIAANAFKGYTKLKKATIGNNMEKVAKNAFYGCKNLKTVNIQTTKFAKKSVGTKAFAKINAKAVITVPKSVLTAYKEILKSAGFNGKGQKVKGKEEDAKINDYNPAVLQFEEELTGFDFGRGDWVTDNRYVLGETVRVRSSFTLLPPIYGHWEKDSRRITGKYLRCNACNKYFPTSFMLAKHQGMELNGHNTCLGMGNYFIGSGANAETWVFVSDPEPCKMVMEYTLPQGISCNKEDIQVCQMVSEADYTDYCTINVSGNHVTVTIDDVKQEPFYARINTEAYLEDMYYSPADRDDDLIEGYRDPITVFLNTVLNDNIETDSNIECTMTYTYKGYSQSKNYSISLHTAAIQIANTDADGNSLSGAEFDLYRTDTIYNADGIGKSDWVLLASGLHAGDVVRGLGIGFQPGEEEYRLAQTKAPDGYKSALPFDFSISINTDGKTVISAIDDDDNNLPVNNGVIKVTVVNAGGSSGNAAGTTVNTPVSTTNPSSSDNSNTNTSGNTSDVPSAEKKAVVTYYKDGVRQFWATKNADVFGADGMLDTASNVKDYSNGAFAGCKLEKITVNGETVSSLPAKVPAGTEICYYYVTN